MIEPGIIVKTLFGTNVKILDVDSEAQIARIEVLKDGRVTEVLMEDLVLPEGEIKPQAVIMCSSCDADLTGCAVVNLKATITHSDKTKIVAATGVCLHCADALIV